MVGVRSARVLIVFSSSEVGGAERSLTRMALAAQGTVSFDLATMDGPGPWSDWCQSLGAIPIVLGRRRRAGAHGRFGVYEVLRLIRLVRTEGYSVVYVIGLRASVVLRLVKPWLRGARLVQGVRWNPNSQSRLDRVFRVIERLLGSRIDIYITNSHAARNTLLRYCGVPEYRVKVIYNGLDKFPDNDNCHGGQMTAVTVANLSPRKGYIEFLDVIERVLARLPAQFIFVGRDDMNGRVQYEIVLRGLEGSVRWVGFVEDIAPWLREARLMVLPSLWGEGCPTSILEGFSYGLPVVAYAIDGIPELIDDRKDGFLITPGDKEAFADRIELLLRDETLARQMGEAGRAKVEDRFTMAKCAELHAEVFCHLLDAERERVI